MRGISMRMYLAAYEQCAAPQQRHFRNPAELDAEIARQLAHCDLGPKTQSRLQSRTNVNRLVEHIRSTWILRYGFTFDHDDGGDAKAAAIVSANDPGTIQPTNHNHVAPVNFERGAVGDALNAFTAGSQHPTTAAIVSANNPGIVQPMNYDHAAPVNSEHGAGGGAPNTLAPDIQHSTVAFVPTNHWPLALLHRPKVLTGPRSGQRSNIGTVTRFADRNLAHQPPLSIGDDVELSYFSIYQTLDDIYTDRKRALVQRIHETMPDARVPRCMEALWRCDDDIDRSKEWLRQRLPVRNGCVVELSDSEGGEQGAGKGVSKKMQRSGKLIVHRYGTLQKPIDLT